MLDYKNLDNYKIAIDDGFQYNDEIDLYNKTINDITLCDVDIYKSMNTYRLSVTDSLYNPVARIRERNWEIFKEKVVKFFESDNNV